MRKIGKSVTADRWEKYLIKVQYARCIILQCWNMVMMSCCVRNPWYELQRALGCVVANIDVCAQTLVA